MNAHPIARSFAAARKGCTALKMWHLCEVIADCYCEDRILPVEASGNFQFPIWICKRYLLADYLQITIAD
jgi:hypothetical protein